MIRRATEEDCVNLVGLSLEVWFNTYAVDGIHSSNSQYAISTFTEDKFKNILRSRNNHILVKAEGSYLRGYILIDLQSYWKGEENGFEIDKLYVHSPYQGKGVGKELLFEVERLYGKTFWLHTWVHNKSIGFYKKYGFKDIGKYEFSLGEEIIENRVLRFERIERTNPTRVK